jgi:uncharacterized protein (TIGR04551 family)
VKLASLVLVSMAMIAQPARADDAPDEDPRPRERSAQFRDIRFSIHGYLRVRADIFDDLDLSRGPTPSTGTTIFPTPAAGGGGHTMEAIDMRLRLEPELRVGQAVRLMARIDVLDNLAWGSTPDIMPSTTAESYATSFQASPTQAVNSFNDAIRVKRVWGEVTLPFGVLSAGRMGALVNWGTGFFVNDGNCLACDQGDAGDRIALTVPLAGHLWSLLYELSSSGPQLPLSAANGAQTVQADARAKVNTLALSFARYNSAEAQRRVLDAHRTLVQYGVLLAYRWQDLDAPAWVQPGGLSHPFGPSAFVERGLKSFSGDLWVLVHKGPIRWELEAATVLGRIADSSSIPGISLREPTVVRQWGGLTSLAYQFRFPLRLRLEVGVASGDSAPGFGVRFPNGQTSTVRGDADGPQLRPPVDNSVDNFAFHPDYHVDLILWRRIVGRVTDAVYVKPTIRAGPFGNAQHHVTLDLSVVESSALYATSPPGQARHLGTEIDLVARYRLDLGFEASLSYGVLVPGAGFRNLELGLDPRPAQLFEAILAYRM